ncbi:nucleoside diphosphate kinase 7 isoform X4 [Myotis daubentonii]|nr:nucleoside diphosphate kinase 7 isoform X4 [Myotis daubentonii]
MMMLSRKEAADFHIDHHSKPFYNELIQFITSGPVIAMEILRDDAICEWKRLLGPANSVVARADAPGSIRALFGADGIRNAAHGPDSFACAAREMELFFPSSGVCGPANSAKFTNCTCCIIKPHAISEGMLGKILMAIRDAGFEISAMQMFNMDRANVEEFYEVYKGVVSEYNEMVTEIYSGPCVALEILQTNPAKTFRELCGPADPEIARHLRPGTLRAVFGKSKIQNAVHCTDLPEDGLLEVQAAVLVPLQPQVLTHLSLTATNLKTSQGRPSPATASTGLHLTGQQPQPKKMALSCLSLPISHEAIYWWSLICSKTLSCQGVWEI